MKKFYVDTCIYLNLWKKEENLVNGKFVWEIAQEFFEKNEEDSIFFYSCYVLKELKYKLTEDEYEKKAALIKFKQEFSKIIDSDEDVESARLLESELNYEISFFDILHMILAKKEGAALVTRDRKLLAMAARFGVKAGKPEDFL